MALLLRGQASLGEIETTSAELNALTSQSNRTFPLSEADKLALFQALGQRLLALYEAEVTAVAHLREAAA
jgi:hypothetical protein